jgi:gamma-glutamyltranspeptidase/glutathione hydrolase
MPPFPPYAEEDSMRDFQFPGRSPVYGANGMAATSMPAATLTAIDTLRAGGNAMDAAVAAAAVLAVIEPTATGIGGDCFCLYAPASTGKVIALNGSGRAPAAATLDWYEQQGIASLDSGSAHCVTIPGAVSAWQTLLEAHGTKSLGELLQPAIRAAEDGFPVPDRVAYDWAYAVPKLQRHNAQIMLPNGTSPEAGTVFRNQKLGQTLRAIAKSGPRAFYEGEVAADLTAALRARGGLHTEADFAAGLNGAEFVTPISKHWRGLDIYQCPPNGSGIIVLMLLGMLERLGNAPDGPLGAIRLHRHIEAARLAFRDRDAFLADPAQAPVPVEKLLAPEYLNALADLIQDDRAMPEMPRAGEAVLPRHRDTTYLCVVDRDGNACSFINSMYEGVGSGIVGEASGVPLHNRGFGFTLERGHPNAIAPGKRPMHTIIPGMAMRDGAPVMPFGVMGGHFQPMGQTLLLTNLLEYGLDLQQSIDLARVFPYAGKVEVERSLPASVAEALTAKGHLLTVLDRPQGGGQAIWIDRKRGVLIGASEPRKDGMALGY